MSCNIFTKGLLQDADFSSATIDTNFIKGLMISRSEAFDGIWYPLMIKPGDMKKDDAKFKQLLSQAGDDLTPTFNPCNCNNNIFGDGSGISDIYNSQDFSNTPNVELDCSYCSTCKDPKGSCSDESECEIRFQKDDYIPKIPYLYQGYISGFNDFKNLKEFPSCSNVGLGKEKFIKMNLNTFSDSYANKELKLNIDLKLQETISEIDYDAYSTRHETEYIHEKSLLKSKIKSRTCGAFLELTGTLPKAITKPYGFSKDTYNNIYIGENKIASHWKWAYTSGILGWYRYYDENRYNDARPMAGIDLYIAPGDTFFATPDGPEYSAVDQEEEPEDFDGEAETDTACPSGLKVVVGNQLNRIIPNDKPFFYMSENIYDRFLECEKKLKETTNYGAKKLREMSAIFATHPQYDDIITNLHSLAVDEGRDIFGQLVTLNRNMTAGTKFESAFDIYHCHNNEVLIKTLAHKYGSYILVEPNEHVVLTLPENSSSSYSIDVNFDMVLPDKKTKFNRARGAMLPEQPNYKRKFEYHQKFRVGDQTLVSTSHNTSIGFDETCSDGKYAKTNYNNYSSLLFYDTAPVTISNNSGSYYFENDYSNMQFIDGNSHGRQIRKYEATAFNPYIDLVAVHKQGGIYVNSLPFNLKESSYFLEDINEAPNGDIEIDFATKDCGVKIYDITIKRLQTSLRGSEVCERFPYSIEDSCKCYGFKGAGGDGTKNQFYGNSSARTFTNDTKYTPSLSTKNSPSLQRYGGYSQGMLDVLFGAGVVRADKTRISPLAYLIEDPLAPYGTEKEDSITLPNYVNTEWKIKLKNLASGRHSDTIVTVNENVNLTANRYAGDPSSEDYLSNHNMLWKKFTTKVKIGGRELYDQQQNKISVSDNTNINVSLHNPFLTKLLSGDESIILAPPDNSENLFNFNTKVYSTRGDESSAVTLTFTRKPRKQFLSFYMPTPTAYGTLKKAEYNPNKGLKRNTSNLKSPFLNDMPFYHHEFYGDTGLEDYGDDTQGIMYGNIDATFRELAHKVDNFELGKKLKLYIKSGSRWYMVGGNKTFSYTLNDKLYIGKPKLFEYLAYTRNSQKIPMVFPLSPKKLFTWNFYLNQARPETRSYRSLTATYPQLNGRESIFPQGAGFTNKLIFPGTRYYFQANESTAIIVPKMTALDEDGNPVENAEGDTQQTAVTTFEDVNKINNTYPAGSIIDFSGAKYFFKGGSSRDASNYIFVGKEYKRILKTSNNLDIDYSDITTHGYIYNTKKKCNQNITIFKQKGGIISPDSTFKIIGKELIVEGFNKDGKPALRDIVEHRVFTKLTLNKQIKIEEFFSVNITDLNKATSLIIYSEKNSDDFSPYLQLGVDKRTKWADVDGYDPTLSLTDNMLNTYKNVTDWYGESPYNNYFYKEIVNNFSSNHFFKIFNHKFQQGKLVYTSDALFCILQKYNVNIDPERVNLINAQDYQNFIPMMDITIPDTSLTARNVYDIQHIKDKTAIGLPVRGYIQSPNWTYEHNDYTSDGFLLPPDVSQRSITFSMNTAVNEDSVDKTSNSTGESVESITDEANIINQSETEAGVARFWIDIDKDDLIETAFVPAGVYSDTLRIDDPTFWLDSTVRSTRRNSAGVRTTFTPTSNTLSTTSKTIPGFEHDTKLRSYAFSIQNIYGDGDDKSKCGAQEFECFTATRGSVDIRAKLKIAEPTTTRSIPDDCSFFFTYDAGQYNPIGQKNMITISRSELPGDNPVDSSYNHCATSYLRPDYKRTIYDPERISALRDGAQVQHDETINDLDKHANEMLFRILYGENQIVNKNILNSKKKPLTASDLVNFADPQITAADIYDEILYNYDKSTSCGCSSGSFNVTGPRTNGTSYNFTIGGVDISLSIIVGTTSVKAQGTIGGTQFTAQLISTGNVKTGVAVTEIGTDLEDTDNTTYTFQKETQGYTSRYYYTTSGRVFTGNCGWSVQGNITTVLYYKPNCYGFNSQDPKEMSRVPPGMSRVDVSNCAACGPNSCGGNPYPIVVGEPCSYSSAQGPCSNRSCADYEYGYCRRKDGCNTAECDGEEEIENFLYTFKQCRTTFNVYGHRYRIGTGTREEKEEEPLEPTETRTPTDHEEVNLERYNVGAATDQIGDTSNLNVHPPVNVDFIQVTDPDPENDFSSVSCGRRIIDGNQPRVPYPYTGEASQGWRTRSPWYRGGAQSHCGAGNGIVGGDLSLNIHCGAMDYALMSPAAWRQVPYDQGEYLALNWQKQNLISPCYGTCDNPQAGEPGYDLCANSSAGVFIPGRKYYTYRQVTSQSIDVSECPQHICSISYNSSSVTLTIGGQTFCQQIQSQRSCLDMTATLPAHAYISSENVNTDCNNEYRGQVTLTQSKQKFKTLRTKKRYTMGGISGGDANSAAAVSTYKSANCGLFSVPNYCHGGTVAICGGGGSYWFALGGWDSRGSYAPAYAAWEERMIEGFSNIDQEIGAETGWYGRVRSGRSDNSGAQRARDVCNANKHISASDIVQGIAPGTCSEVKFSHRATPYTKYRVGGEGGVETGSYNIWTTTAYVEYDYIRPVTIQDILKGWSEGDSAPCEPGGNSSSHDDFPEWYARSLGIETTDTLGYPIQNYGKTGNYVRRKQNVQKLTYCGESLTSYVPDDYYKGGNPTYPFGGAPCGRSDYNCWARNRDWITVWN